MNADTSPRVELNISMDDARQIVTIEGVHYSYGVFQCLGIAPVGDWIRIVDRKDGVLTVERAPAGAVLALGVSRETFGEEAAALAIAQALRARPTTLEAGSPEAGPTLELCRRQVTMGADVGDRDPDCTCDHPISHLHLPTCALAPQGLS